MAVKRKEYVWRKNHTYMLYPFEMKKLKGEREFRSTFLSIGAGETSRMINLGRSRFRIWQKNFVKSFPF